MRNKIIKIFSFLLLFTALLVTMIACGKKTENKPMLNKEQSTTAAESVSESVTDETVENIPDFLEVCNNIPDYNGDDVIVVNNDEPMFSDEEKTYSGTYIHLSELDEYGRCGSNMACVGIETVPAEDREDISDVKPTGWVQKKYSGHWLWNRSHLLMFALTGLNDEPCNLITGTEYFNQKLMLAYESQINQYVHQFNGHVVYRVTPVFDGSNLVAKGVLMEAYSIEYPEECTFCVFIYNIADPDLGVIIDYATGESCQN